MAMTGPRPGSLTAAKGRFNQTMGTRAAVRPFRFRLRWAQRAVKKVNSTLFFSPSRQRKRRGLSDRSVRR